MNITPPFARSTAKFLVGTAIDTGSVGGVTISSNGIATDGWVLVATGSNSAIWRDAISFGSNTNDVSSVGTMGSSSSNTRADHVHRGVRAISHASNTLYGDVTLATGTGIAITTAGQTLTIAGSASVAAGTYVEAKNGGSEVIGTATAAGTYTINLANGNWQDITLTADTTFTFTGATSGEGDSFVLLLRPGGHTATWPASVIWPGGTAPTQKTTAGTTSIYTFLSRDGGTTWYGFHAGASIGTPSISSNTFAEVALTVDASMAITAPNASSILFSAPFFNEVVADSGEVVWHGSDIVHSLVRLY